MGFNFQSPLLLSGKKGNVLKRKYDMKKYAVCMLVFCAIAMSYADDDWDRLRGMATKNSTDNSQRTKLTRALSYEDNLSPIEKEDGIYISAKVGFSSVTAKYDLKLGNAIVDSKTEKLGDLYGGSLALGYKFNQWLRLELEGGMFGNNVDGNPTTIGTFMGQFHVDLPINTIPVTPYFNLGVGNLSYRETDSDDGTFSASATHANAGIGLTYAFHETATLDIGYRFGATGALIEEKIGPYKAQASLRTSTLLIGLRHIF